MSLRSSSRSVRHLSEHTSVQYMATYSYGITHLIRQERCRQERVQPSCLRDVRVVMARTKGCTLKGDSIQRKSLLRVAGENAVPNKHGNEDLRRA